MSESLKIVFMGTPQFAADILKNISENNFYEVVSVYTMPDAIRSRGKKKIASPVKTMAEKLDILVETPQNFKSSEEIDKLKSYKPDFICVAAYGMILPREVLDIPKYETLNVHASLLPRWRGAAPVQRAILAGDDQLGVSIMQIDEGLDTGDFCKQSSFDLRDMYLQDAYNKIAKIGSKDLIESIDAIVKNDVKWTKQDENCVSYAEKLQKRELWLKKSDGVQLAYRKVLASDSSAVCKCNIAGRNLSLIKAKISSEIDETSNNWYIQFGDGYLEICELKPDGKNAMDAKSFLMGLQNKNKKLLDWNEIECA